MSDGKGMKDLIVLGRIILKWILMKEGRRSWIGFLWLKQNLGGIL
jgi:hypothetical protein